MRLLFIVLSIPVPTFEWETYLFYGKFLIGHVLPQEILAQANQKSLHGPEPILFVPVFPLLFGHSSSVSVPETIQHGVNFIELVTH